MTQLRPARIRTLSLAMALLAGLAAFALSPALAQTPGVGPGTGGAGTPGSSAPAANGPAVGVTGGVPASIPARPLTLADVVSAAVGGNSGLVAARQRLQKAQELINQVNAQARPQFRADAADTYSSYRAFAPALPNPVVSSPTLPGGGQIPVVVDQGNGFSTAFIGGGGGGNAPSTGSFSSTGLSATPLGGTSTPDVGTSPASGIGTPGAGGGTVGSPGPVAPTSPSPSVPASPTPASPAPPSSVTPATPGAAPAPSGTGSAGPGIGSAAEFIMPTLPPVTEADATPTPAATTQVAEAATPREEAHDNGTSSGASGGGSGTSGAVNGGAAGRLGQRNAYAARVAVSQLIDLFGLVSTARDAQRDVRDFYALDIERLGNETALAAKNLFFNALLGQQQVDTQQEQVRYAQENVRITQARLRQGIVSRFDVLTAQTALSTAQQQLIAAQDSRDLAQADLSYLLGTDPDQPLALQTPPLPDLNQPIDLRASTQIALTRRPEVRQASANIQEAQSLVKLAGSPLLPTLGLVANAERASLASATQPQSFANIGAELAVPLDDGGATRSRVRAARVDVQTQALTLEQIKLSVSLEVRQATLNIRNAQAQVGAAQTGVTQAQEAVRLAYLRYQGGLGTFLDVLNALAQLARTRDNLSNADFFYQTSLAQLVRAVGGR